MSTSPSTRGAALVGLVALVVAAAGFGRLARPAAAADDGVRRAEPRVVVVQMLGDTEGYRFSPTTISVRAGDRIRFDNVSGPPHNVVVWPDSIPKAAGAKLVKAMPNAVAPLTGPFLLQVGEKYTISTAGLPAGRYRYYCQPHLALGMIGAIEVK
jgi:plastocyanin